MKNGDNPAHPTLFYNESTGTPNGHDSGLTKREHAAILNQAAIYSNRELQLAIYKDRGEGITHDQSIAIVAIKAADALLKELGK